MSGGGGGGGGGEGGELMRLDVCEQENHLSKFGSKYPGEGTNTIPQIKMTFQKYM